MASESTGKQLCASCKTPETEIKLRRCERCKKVAYCNKTCQSSDWRSHKASCKAPNYILKIHLCPSTITSPSVIRTLSCPATATFENLHHAIQVAFNWANAHTFDFKIKDPNAEPEPEITYESYVRRWIRPTETANGPRQNFLRITHGTPGVNGFPAFGMPVDYMHRIHREHSQTPEVHGSDIKLSKVFENKEYGASDIQVEYEYDFGDSWTHEIRIVGREDLGPFRVLDGEGHGVAEDVGGAREWQRLKRAYRAAKPNRRQKEAMEDFESFSSHRDISDLAQGRQNEWDKDEINRKLLHLTRAVSKGPGSGPGLHRRCTCGMSLGSSSIPWGIP